MKVILALAIFVLAGVALVNILIPPAGHTVPTSSVAPEVCEYNGPIVPPVTEVNGLLYVPCKSGIVQVVTAKPATQQP